MSVLIKGMEMPESCFYCRFRKKVNPEEIMCLATGEIFEETFTATIKMRNGAGKCPLIEVTEPHGRLIDADRVTAESIKRTGKRLLAIDTAPTVIEAEGGSDGRNQT